MKTLLKSAVAVFFASVFTFPSFAAGREETAPVCVRDTVVKKDTVIKEDAPLLLAMDEVTYTRIETSAVPSAVTQGIAAKYEGYTVGEACKGSDNSYKLVIRKADVSLTVYYNEAGEFQKEEASAGAEGSAVRI